MEKHVSINFSRIKTHLFMHQSIPVSRYWRLSFLILSAAVLIIMPLLSHSYGQSGDEWLQIEYGQDIWNYFFNGNPQALNYDAKSLQYVGQQFYGGFFDFLMEILHHWFPSVPILFLRHFFNAITGALMMIFTGLFAYRISGKNWMTGLLALLFIVFSPRIFGESMNNPKDIPLGCGFIIGMYCWLAFLQEFPAKKWKYAIGVAVGFAIAFGVRSAGGILQIAFFGVMTLLYWFTQKPFKERMQADGNKLLKQAIFILAGALAVGYIIALLTWPWGLESPISHPIESLKEMTNRSVTLRVFFEGIYRPNSGQPWYYELKWIMISNPLVVIAGVGIFLVLWFKMKARYGMFTAVFLVFAAFFTPLYMIYKKSSVHDTWRHLFFIYPFWVAAAALGWQALTDYFSNPKYYWIPFAAAVLGLTPAIAWTVKSHPNQYVYFNETVGGLSGAYGYYETDYYQNTGLQAADWMLKNVKPIAGRKLLVGSNMLGFGYYFAKDTSWMSSYYVRYGDRHQKAWDYYITYSRYVSAAQLQNGTWPPANVVHTIEEDGVPLCVIIKRKSTAGMEAYEALQAKDFEKAATLYGQYVVADASDESAWMNYAIALASTGQMDGGIAAMKKAIAIDNSRPEMYQLLAQLYQAKGDNQAAQSAMNQANSLIIEEQENQ